MHSKFDNRTMTLVSPQGRPKVKRDPLGGQGATRSGQPWGPNLAAVVTMLGATVLAGCGGSSAAPEVNTLPTGVTDLGSKAYRATKTGAAATAAGQDLLTGGLGTSGLINTAAATLTAFVDPANPTADELRRNALQANYRGLVDNTANGGYGVLYGPNIDLAGKNTLGEGLVPGLEYIGVLDDGSGRKRVTMAVQVPDSFDVNAPCIVVGPSSGSRGVYGAIGSAGDWGLKRGCAVALTDAGKGVGLYDMTDDSVNRIDGTRATRTAAGTLSHFAANVTDAARAVYNAAFPNRLALKQAHSQMNPEKDWGTDTLTAVSYALYALNQQHAPVVSGGTAKSVRFTAANTMVIAGSVSNGGAAILRAAEQDTSGLIDGVVAGEPSAQPNTTAGYGVQLGGVPVAAYGKPIMDYFTIANLYQACAALAPTAALTEVSVYNYIGLTGQTTTATNRCTQLAAKGLITGSTTALQAADALAKMRAAGWTSDNDTMHNAHFGLGNAMIISMMYTNTYGKFSVTDNLCGMSAAVVAAGVPVAITANAKAASFATGNGTINGSPATLPAVVYNDSVGGAKVWNLGVSPSTGVADFSLDAALCQRALVTGVNTVTGVALTAATTPTKAQSDAVRAGIAEVQLNGNLRNKPTLIVVGRSDALLPINHSERAYTAYNRLVEGAASKLSYVEIENAHHFDAFNSFSGFDTRFVPLHTYFTQAMNAMYANLKSGTALPLSQVVRTSVRGGTPGAAPAITAANVPGFVATPTAANAIGFSGTSVNVPN